MSFISVPVETSQFIEFAAFLRRHGGKDPVAAVSEAISYWMENAEWKEDLAPVGQGYTWKRVHLPAGTILRIRSGGSYRYATVENDSPVFEGNRVSPNQFALAATGSARDAWRDVWVRRPEDADYVLADELRKQAD